jgi:hypothetical protein
MLGLLPIFERLDGFVGGQIMTNAERGEVCSLSYWDTTAHEFASHGRADTVAAHLAGLLDGGFESHLYEVDWMRPPEAVPLPEWLERGWPAWRDAQGS